MRMLALFAMLASGAAGTAQGPRTPVPAAAVVTSAAPVRVAVTLYRNPQRPRMQAMDLRRLGGFALVSETRRVRLPAGDSVLRFEGVAGGIVPASAIVEGLPGGTIEKNRDARLLSPAALIDGTLGRQVTLRRTNRATGAVRDEEATILAGPAGGVVLRTPGGVEALRCSGLPETPVYRRVPAGLSPRPTLSVTTRSPRATTVTVTLSYLAERFDWTASYVATLAPDGGTLDLSAWMTLANGNAEPFPAAAVQAVAGRLERRGSPAFRQAVAALRLSCYPLGTTTSDLTEDRYEAQDIVVTASRAMGVAMMAPPPPPPPPPPAPPPPPPPPEDLGDLKLYRVPFHVTVSPNGQKQVALLARAKVPFERLYRIPVYPGVEQTAVPTQITLRMRNRADAGLGLALPAGATTLYGWRGGERLVLGTGFLGDTAEGERVMLSAGTSRQVTLTQAIAPDKRCTVTLANANATPVTVEVRIGQPGADPFASPSQPLTRIDGIQTWTTTVPANGTATLEYGA